MDNFVVSARKYRPAVFKSVVGQSHITSTLKNAIARNQLAHAYLFCGPRGVGKTTCARIFAKAINCLSPVDDEACGQCESCRSFNEGRSFNIHELDAASNNSVDDIRSLTEQVRIPPQIGRYSVYIIDEVHMLSAQAFNAFLKTLEEPPAHAVFILATTEKHKIIPTILSRCQIFDFNRIRVEDSVEYLKFIASQEGVTCDDESLHLIALKADGGMRDALSMFDKAVSFCGNNLQFKQVSQTLNVLDYDTYFNLTSIVTAGDYPAALTLFDEVLRKGFSPQSFIGGLNGHLRDLLMTKNPQTLPLLEVSGSLLERYKQQGAESPAGLLFEAISILTALDGTLRTATSQRLNVELGLMKLCALGQKKNSDLSESPSDKGLKGELPPLRNDAPQQPRSSAPDQSTQRQPEQPKAAPTPVNRPTTPPESAQSAMPSATTQPARQAPQPVGQAPQPAAAVGREPAQAAPLPHPAERRSEMEPAPSPSAMPKPSPSVNGAKTSRKSILTGNSIDAILNQTKAGYDTADAAAEEQKTEEKIVIDPECEQKITAVKNQFLNEVHRHRPRIAMALEEMRVQGSCICLTVPTDSLFEEIMRNRNEILTLLTELAGIEGRVEFNVVVSDEEKARKPIKVEDKLKFLTDKNPTLNLLRKELNLETE